MPYPDYPYILPVSTRTLKPLNSKTGTSTLRRFPSILVNHILAFDANMAGQIASDEKAPPNTTLTNDNQSNSETEDLAMLALEKRVLRKTDMVVLPMVSLPVLLLR
jgi:hypothetical protein